MNGTLCWAPLPRNSFVSTHRRQVTDGPWRPTSKSRAPSSKRATGYIYHGRSRTATHQLFEEPDRIILDRKQNRHFAFGLGVHRCIGSNLARVVFKSMLTAVLDRMPDYQCDPERTVHYDTIGMIQGMRNLPATFTPAPKLGAGLDETLDDCSRYAKNKDSPGPSPSSRGRPASTPDNRREAMLVDGGDHFVREQLCVFDEACRRQAGRSHHHVVLDAHPLLQRLEVGNCRPTRGSGSGGHRFA